LVPDLLQRCATGAHPVKLTLVQGLSAALRQKVEMGELDVALCYGAMDEGGKGLIPLFSEDLYLVGKPAALHSRQPIAFTELSRFPLTLDRKRQTIRLLIEETASAHGVALDVQQEVELVDVKRALIQRHGCFTIVPYGLFLEEIRQGRMGARHIANPSLPRTMYVARKVGLSEPLFGLLVGWLHEIVRNMITEGELPWRISNGKAKS
jgi:LysR family nitrogen assimilation transcriptional regulator